MKKVFFGQIGKLKEDKIDEYKELHANPWPDVLKTIRACNIVNYSIFQKDQLVFGYFEYTGGDYEKDMEKMAQDPVTQEWWKHTKPCFIKYSFSGAEEFYCDMEQIFHLK